MTFTILLGSFGTGTCMWVDLGDNSSLLVFGHQSCPGEVDVDSINPKIVAEPRLKYTFKHPDTERITISHVYQRVGFYNVKMNASNILSTAAYEMVAVVLPYICKNPNITIKGKFSGSFFKLINVVIAISCYHKHSAFKHTVMRRNV